MAGRTVTLRMMSLVLTIIAPLLTSHCGLAGTAKLMVLPEGLPHAACQRHSALGLAQRYRQMSDRCVTDAHALLNLPPTWTAALQGLFRATRRHGLQSIVAAP